MFKFSALWLASLAGATSWNDFKGFRIPSSSDAQCSRDDRVGFDWTDLAIGSVSFYAGFSFDGFSCSSEFKQSGSATQHGLNPKFIEGTISTTSGPSLACGPGSSFSITRYQISASNDTEIDLLYDMPDGSTCKQKAFCLAAGTFIQNDQCGGARRVSFKMPQGPRHDTCQIGIHSIEFDCATPSSSPWEITAPSPTSSSPTSLDITVFTNITSYSQYSTVRLGSTSTSSRVSRSGSSIPFRTSTAPTNFSNSSISMATSSNVSPVSQASSTSTPSRDFLTPSTLASTAQIPISLNSSLAWSLSTYLTGASANTISFNPPSVPGLPCPDVLPRCVATWIPDTDCTSNSHSSCYCTRPGFTKRVTGCIFAYGTESEIPSALSYLLGICAPWIPENPGLVTDCAVSLVQPLTTITGSLGDTSPTDLYNIESSALIEGEAISHDVRTTQLQNHGASGQQFTHASTNRCNRCAVATVPAPVPYTTITVTQNYPVATSLARVPSLLSTITWFSTTIIIPQVHFATATTHGATFVSVGLMHGQASAFAESACSSVHGNTTRSAISSSTEIPPVETNGLELATSKATHAMGTASLMLGLVIAVVTAILDQCASFYGVMRLAI